MTATRELVGFVFDHAAEALDRGALLVLSLSDGDLAWSVLPAGSDLDLDDVRYLHRKAVGIAELDEPAAVRLRAALAEAQAAAHELAPL